MEAEGGEEEAEMSATTLVATGGLSASWTSCAYPPLSMVTSTDEPHFFKILFSRVSTSFCSGWLLLALRDNCALVGCWYCDSDPLGVAIGGEHVPVGKGSSMSSAPRGWSVSCKLTRSPRPEQCRLNPNRFTLVPRIWNCFREWDRTIELVTLIITDTVFLYVKKF